MRKIYAPVLCVYYIIFHIESTIGNNKISIKHNK